MGSIKRVVILLAFSVLGSAQTLPQDWVGGGIAYNGYASPVANGWVSYAHLFSQTGPIYSYTTWDITGTPKFGLPNLGLQSSERTGLATTLKQYQNLVVLGFAGAGVSTTASSIGGSFGGGGVGIYRPHGGRWTVELAVRVFKTSSTGSEYIFELGFGRILK